MTTFRTIWSATIVLLAGLIRAQALTPCGTDTGDVFAAYKTTVYEIVARRVRSTNYRTVVGGVTLLSLTVDRRGRIIASKLRKSSGVAMIDAAAMGAFPVNAHLPPIPPCFSGDSIEFTFPVRFS